MLSLEATKGTRTFMISFRRGDYIIEELREMLKKEGVDAALITSGIGSFDKCKLHTIASTGLPPKEVFIDLEGPIEVGTMHGSVAGGEPHIHVVAHDTKNDKISIGHLHAGTRCCYRAELGLIILNDIKTKRVADEETGLIDIVQADDQKSVCLKRKFICCKYVARHMLEKGKGKIINISSVRGFQGRTQDPAYAPSKGAVNQLTHSLAIEWGPKGINVNGIAPVFTKTPMAIPILNDPVKLDWVLSRIHMKRLGELDDLFGPVVFLASEASNFVNRHVLLVDGGWVAA